MDQMTSSLGRENELLALLCQPAQVEGFVPIPHGVAFWGIDSGIRHAVSGADYTSVRCGAFMGYRIIAEAAGLSAIQASDAPGVLEINDDIWHGYLANIAPDEFARRFGAIVPERMLGKDFLARYGGTTDRSTRVDPDRLYAVRAPTLHPIEENARVERFRALLHAPITVQLLVELGGLMAAAHASYSACGLASDGTDLLVKLVQDAGPTSGLYGAKITGGGSGGTVAVLGRANAGPLVDGVARQYSDQTGRPVFVFRGSSPGAYQTRVMQVTV
jgi:L-arabinokinase